jgi:hypothetical protein
VHPLGFRADVSKRQIERHVRQRNNLDCMTRRSENVPAVPVEKISEKV